MVKYWARAAQCSGVCIMVSTLCPVFIILQQNVHVLKALNELTDCFWLLSGQMFHMRVKKPQKNPIAFTYDERKHCHS